VFVARANAGETPRSQAIWTKIAIEDWQKLSACIGLGVGVNTLRSTGTQMPAIEFAFVTRTFRSLGAGGSS